MRYLFFAFFVLLFSYAFANGTLVDQNGKQTFAPIVKKTVPAVVNIFTSDTKSAKSNPLYNDPALSQLLPPNSSAPLGSGVIVHPRGIIVTNAHVIDGASEIRVVLYDKREYRAQIVAVDKTIDMAVLRLATDEKDFPYILLADSDSIEVGDVVLAIGNPFGIGQTVTSGIISALPRPQIGISSLGLYIQTDASINPGNSGGALVNSFGNLVGINSAIFSKAGGSLGIAFAVPSNMVRVFVERSLNGEQLRKIWLGMSGKSVDAEIAAQYGLKKPEGIIVTKTYPNGPADSGGIMPGDIIISFDDSSISDMLALAFRVNASNVGDVKPVAVIRKGREYKTTVKLSTPPETTPRDAIKIQVNSPLYGVTLVNFSPAVAYEIGEDYFNNGVMIYDIDTKTVANQLKLRPGDMVRVINGRVINNTEDAKNALSTNRTGNWIIEFERSGKPIKLEIKG